MKEIVLAWKKNNVYKLFKTQTYQIPNKTQLHKQSKRGVCVLKGLCFVWHFGHCVLESLSCGIGAWAFQRLRWFYCSAICAI
jgi:hypothetical protein